MATPITLDTLIGYVVAEDVYIRFTEYYGDGTIYGRTELSMPDGSSVKGEGKFKKELVELGVLMSDVVAGSLGGELVMVQNEPPSDVPAEVVAEVPADAAVEVPADAAVEVPADAPEVPEVPTSKTYTVVTSFMGFKVSREFNVKIDELTNTLYLE
jgi:hypothetical protein